MGASRGVSFASCLLKASCSRSSAARWALSCRSGRRGARLGQPAGYSAASRCDRRSRRPPVHDADLHGDRYRLRRGAGPAPVARRRLGDAQRCRRGTSAGRSTRMRQTLVIAEVALSLVLLASAGLLGRTLVALQHVDPGFVADHAIGAEVTLRKRGIPTPPRRSASTGVSSRRCGRCPGIVSSGVTTTLPLSGNNMGLGFTIDGRHRIPDTSVGLVLRDQPGLLHRHGHPADEGAHVHGA